MLATFDLISTIEEGIVTEKMKALQLLEREIISVLSKWKRRQEEIKSRAEDQARQNLYRIRDLKIDARTKLEAKFIFEMRRIPTEDEYKAAGCGWDD